MPTAPQAPAVHRRRRAFEHVDRALDHWLGYAAPPADRAVQSSSFTINAPGDYCTRCGDSIGRGEQTDKGCASCRNHRALADAVVRLGPYVDDLRDWILRLKYERWSPIGRELGRMLADAITTANVVDPEYTIVVPMPMPWQRRMYRGIDHAQVIAASAAHHLDAPLIRALSKKHGPPQVALSPTERQRHGGRNLRIRKRLGGWKLEGAHLILIDDVRTTGTTLRRAVRLLRELQPAKIVVAVAAVADPASRRIRHAQGLFNTEDTENTEED